MLHCFCETFLFFSLSTFSVASRPSAVTAQTSDPGLTGTGFMMYVQLQILGHIHRLMHTENVIRTYANVLMNL